MDAFALACGFAGFDPDYFYHHMDLDEFEAIGQTYRESWEKTRLQIAASGAKITLPWDGETDTPQYTANERVSLASKLTEILKKRQTKRVE